MHDHRDHHPSADLPDREVQHAPRARTRSCSRSAGSANKIQIKDAVQKLFNVKVESVNTMVYRGKDRRMGRGYAKMQNWKKAIVTLAEGENIDFFARERRRAEMGIKTLQADIARLVASTRAQRLQGDHPGQEAGEERSSSTRPAPAAATRTAASPAASVAVVTSSATASSTGGATRSACRRRSRRSSTIRTARRASRSSTTPTARRRYILAPDGLSGRRQGRREPQRGHQAGQLDAAPVHPARHDDPQHRDAEGQGRSARSLGRLAARRSWRRTATTRRSACRRGEIRKIHLDCRATIGQVSNIDHANISPRQGRSHALARQAPAQPRRHDEPGRSPDGRRRRSHVRWSSPLLAVGPAREGSQDAQQQAHRRHDRQASRN